MTQTLQSVLVDSIVRQIELEAGLAFPEHRRGEVEESIHRAALASGTEDLADYLLRIEADPRLREDLAAAVTIGETYFMRDLEQFSVLREVVLPQLIAMPEDGLIERALEQGAHVGLDSSPFAGSRRPERRAPRRRIPHRPCHARAPKRRKNSAR